MKIGRYHCGWWKAVNILKQYEHLLFAGQEIQKGSRDEKIKVVYEKFMSTLVDNLSVMLSFFAFVQIKVIKEMVHEKCYNVPKHLGGNKWSVKLSFTSYYQKTFERLWRYRHGLGKCPFGCGSRSKCYN